MTVVRGPSAGGTRPLFDTHAHAISADATRYAPAANAKNAGAKPFTVEQLIAGMDQLDVARACVVQRYHYYGNDNSYVLDACAAHPDRLTPVLVMNGEDPATPRLLEQLTSRQRIGGIRLCGPSIDQLDTAWLNSPGVMRLWEKAAELGLPITLIMFEPHASYNLPVVKFIAETLPEAQILIDHLGTIHGATPQGWAVRSRPDHPPVIDVHDLGITPALRALRDCPNVSYKFTGINLDCLAADGIDDAVFLRRFADEFGVNRIVLGSDIGQTSGPYARLAEGLRRAIEPFDDDERRLLLHGNAERLYGSW